MKKGFFITFEGGEGSGKTTLIKSIKKHLKPNFNKYLFTREPGGTFLGEEIRRILLKKRKEKISAKAELCLFLASRSQHIKEVILPALNKGKTVFSDRYNDSSIAYQGYARKLGMENVLHFSHFVIEDAIPDLTIYLDVDPKIGLARFRSKYDRIESENIFFHKQLRKGFLILAKKFPKRVKLIDANVSSKEVFKNAMQYIEKFLQ